MPGKAYFSVKARGRNLQYQWYRKARMDGQEDEPVPPVEAKYHGSEKHSLLEISDVENDDEGVYYCKVWSSEDENDKQTSKDASLRLGECMFSKHHLH